MNNLADDVMPRVSWGELTREKAHALIAEVEPSFFGGPMANDPYDSKRLREATNLMLRLATRMALSGSYAASPARAMEGQPNFVLCAFESELDRNRVAALVDARLCVESDGWLSRRAFPLTDAIHERLVLTAGEADNRNAGRRQKEREESFRRGNSLRWEER